MTESAADWHARVHARLASDGPREAPWTSWPTWPFEEDTLTPRPLEPLGDEQPRRGAGGIDCEQCSRSDDPSYIFWRDDLMMLGAPFEPTSLPFVAFPMPRRHGDLSDLTPDEAARMGQLTVAVERAACEVLDIPRLQVFRWGDGTEHLHWWLMARPTGTNQLRGTFLPLWDDLLPMREQSALRADLDAVAVRLVDLAGGETP
ncbi:hypothetical protein ncot_12970 [Nocardioides sp. JQ2195]|uniref:HIT family protein n=1 Tax=Nocardioides sp. JQ2195 TaxID=2592334 RepID=UPI00143EE3E2|nr:hypothetical protein [Nocardioides sp. JQ2195]QIX27414.1 hypothetical protein ncot_12970 [Nocardioides sp. JQ2195]